MQVKILFILRCKNSYESNNANEFYLLCRRDDVHIVHHNNSDISPLYKPKFNKQMNIRDVFRFRRHRRVIGGMRDAAIGHATTVYGAVVTLAAFYTLGILTPSTNC